MIWAGNTWVEDGVCRTCFQPECSGSGTLTRPAPGYLPTQLQPGGREYRGYQEWAVHPDEACFLLHRGYAIVDGRRAAVAFIHNEAFVTQLRVEGSDPLYTLEAGYYTADAPERTVAR